MLCPCDSNKNYSVCCAPLHSGEQFASSAKQLMISRFTAYCMANYQYIYETYGREQRRTLSNGVAGESDADCQWVRLKVIQTSQTDSTGIVEFIAVYAIENELYQLHETSCFEIQDGRWVYTTGNIHDDSGIIRKKRNDPCPCHSGKKLRNAVRCAHSR